jgi:hypothetical protein
MKKLISLFLILPLTGHPATPEVCATPMDCYQVKERERLEEIRLKKEQEEAVFRQLQLELEAAQLRELQEQRAVLEEELTEMNDTQSRLEERQIKEEEKKAIP